MATEGNDSSSSATSVNQYPLTIIVTLEIKEDRVAEFVTTMQKNALASRTLEVVILILCNIFRHMSDRM
jgi:hypothetical protein